MIFDILVEKGETLVKGLGEKAKFVKLDVKKRDEWNHAIQQTEEAFGPIDILVHNAGIDIMKKFIGFT